MNDQETQSKDNYFQQLAEISNAMSAAHGRDFAIGTLVLAARYVAEHATPPAAEEAARMPAVAQP
ncbi:hypothetical protein [Methylibium sp.]|uniref:hypothetical protein n=1 Tax=Methylibium sp. TaxID=2067992 RepID=UPI003D115011